VKKWIVASVMTLTAICTSLDARDTASANSEPVANAGTLFECVFTEVQYTSYSACRAACPGGCVSVW
jgi:hypothetical protein